jgi:hypothetical protein
MATATVLPRANEVVQEGADVKESRWVKGEIEGSAESTGHCGALARSVSRSCACWRHWARLGASCSGRCRARLRPWRVPA